MGIEYRLILRDVKYPRIEISPLGEVKVIVPPNADAEDLVKRKKEWIEKKLREIEEAKMKFLPLSSKLILDGEFYELIESEEFGVNPKFHVVLLPNNDLGMLKRWLKSQLREELEFKVRLFSSVFGVKYRKIYIRFQKTKWASCSEKGNLSFNLMLMALPEELRDYIIIHEVAHLKFQKHSRAFWELVREYYPDYMRAQRGLREYWLALQYNEVWRKLREV
ncbi:SprT family zinc-dependent metalloprotease [Thermococcus sp. GR6]|uniref:M48 family metallopeptidase n=1 Tax=Thermococcus sp. GR6 TaxID=1638256 RepID=UPI00142FA245|nr:M48 family peptidase [Thermococcus sp. GR6]